MYIHVSTTDIHVSIFIYVSVHLCNLSMYISTYNLSIYVFTCIYLSNLSLLGIQQMQELKEQQESKNKDDEDMYRIRKGTFDLLPEADENISKLQVTIMSLYVHCTCVHVLCVHYACKCVHCTCALHCTL